jgi:16S rRNA C967 or C1407 C5-methylase (RsmB/RsmF family)/NOL1/NOP2/fmu family ribosome biogenesis protein
MNLPVEFASSMKAQLGDDFPAFEAALSESLPTSVRFNPIKKIDEGRLDISNRVPWCEQGHYLKHRPVFTLDPAFHAGAYYVQEASSMFLHHALKQIVDFSKPLKVLDLCAAPGGKSTLLAALLGEKDLLVVNEVIKARVNILKENMLKWGFPHVVVVNQDPETFSDLEGFFDIVLVDAPCSGEGLFRKDPKAMNEWSGSQVAMCAARQKRILSAAGLLVAPDGYLVYSTCTYNTQENLENVKWLTRTLDFESQDFDVPAEWGIAKNENTFQFYPHKVQGEGFFLAVLKQNAREENRLKGNLKLYKLPSNQSELLRPWIKASIFEDYQFYSKKEGTILALHKDHLKWYSVLFQALTKRSSGLEIGIFKGQSFVPSHGLALSTIVSDTLSSLELTEEAALKYLKKEAFETADAPDGWLLVRFCQLNLGWAKKMGDRVNNYLPTEWRIRMEID